jgi:hypothetical protein
MTPKEIHKDMIKTLYVDSLSYSTIKKLAAHFKRTRDSIQDDSPSHSPKTSPTDDQVEAILHTVLDSRFLSIGQIVS